MTSVARIALPKSGIKRVEHSSFAGLPISLEYRKGDTRSGKDASGKQWFRQMHADYGYIRKTRGTDGDHADVYIGPKDDAQTVYVVNQMKAPSFKEFDEQKFLLGFESLDAAKKTYLKHYPDARILGTIKAMSLAKFKEKVMSKANHGKKIAGLPVRGAGDVARRALGRPSRSAVTEALAKAKKPLAGASGVRSIPKPAVSPRHQMLAERYQQRMTGAVMGKAAADNLQRYVEFAAEIKLAGENLESSELFSRHADFGKDAETELDRARKKKAAKEEEGRPLTESDRDKIKTKNFAIPEQEKYPIHDASHARNALTRVKQHGTPKERARVQAAVDKKWPGIEQEGEEKTSSRRRAVRGAARRAAKKTMSRAVVLERAAEDLGREAGEKVVQRYREKAAEMSPRQQRLAERVDDVGIGILAAPYATKAVSGLKNRRGTLGAVGRGADVLGKRMRKHETAMELGGLALLAPGITNRVARGIDKAAPAKTAELEKIAAQYVPDWEYMTEMEKQAILGALGRLGARAVAGLRGAGTVGRAAYGASRGAGLGRLQSLRTAATGARIGGGAAVAGKAALQRGASPAAAGRLMRLKSHQGMAAAGRRGEDLAGALAGKTRVPAAPGGPLRTSARPSPAPAAAGAPTPGAAAATPANKRFLRAGNIAKAGVIGAGGLGLYGGYKAINTAAGMVDPRVQHGAHYVPPVGGMGRPY